MIYLTLACILILICSGLGTAYFIYRNCKIQNEYKVLKKQKEILNSEVKQSIEKIKELDKKQIELTQDIANATKERKDSIERAAEAKEATNRLLESEQKRLAAEIKNKQDILILAYTEKERALEQSYLLKAEDAQRNINLIKSQLTEYQEKQRVINEQLRKEQLLQDEENAHRISLSIESKDDIEYLVSIEKNIHNKETLHKLIWTEYLQRPFNQMLKNTLGSSSPKNVIYCIENINNHKKYIGKTRGEYKDRQINHMKASLQIGTISHQEIHNALFGHWDEFSFYILEEVDNESNLSEREKFYINFYETDKYGYNLKVG